MADTSADKDAEQLQTELVSREASHGDRIQTLRGHEQTCSSRSRSKRNECFWQEEKAKMFLKCSVGTRGEGDSEPGLSWNSRSKTKLGSFWQRGKVKTQAESRAPSVLYQCFEGLDEGNRKIQEILSKKSQAVTPVSHRDFWFCSAKSSQDYF